MTTSAAVRAAWEGNLWNDPSIVEPKIFWELQTEGLIDADIDDLYFEGEINFFQTITKSYQEIRITGQMQIVCVVEVRYYKEIVTNRDSFNTVIDRLETIRDLVAVNLGTSWQGVVDFYQPQQSETQIQTFYFGSVPVWRGTEQYTGQLAITI